MSCHTTASLVTASPAVSSSFLERALFLLGYGSSRLTLRTLRLHHLLVRGRNCHFEVDRSFDRSFDRSYLSSSSQRTSGIRIEFVSPLATSSLHASGGFFFLVFFLVFFQDGLVSFSLTLIEGFTWRWADIGRRILVDLVGRACFAVLDFKLRIFFFNLSH